MNRLWHKYIKLICTGYLDSATEEAMEEFRRFEEEMEQQSNKELQGLLSINESERRIGKSMEKAASYTSNKYVEAALNSATVVVLPYVVTLLLCCFPTS